MLGVHRAPWLQPSCPQRHFSPQEAAPRGLWSPEGADGFGCAAGAGAEAVSLPIRPSKVTRGKSCKPVWVFPLLVHPISPWSNLLACVCGGAWGEAEKNLFLLFSPSIPSWKLNLRGISWPLFPSPSSPMWRSAGLCAGRAGDQPAAWSTVGAIRNISKGAMVTLV